MPEGDSIWRLTKRLRAQLVGRTVVASKFRIARFATSDLTGATVIDVRPRGKHLLMRFDNELTLHGHLRMDGSWKWHRKPGWRPGTRNDDVRAWLDFGEEGVLAAHAMPVLELLRTDDEASVVGHLGPDILDDEWESPTSPLAQQAVANLRTQPSRQIAEALLDQRNLCGIGNLYKVECLFVAGVNPYTPVSEVKDLDHVVDVARRQMRLNLASDRGSQPTAMSRKRGESHWAYGRYNRPCFRCRTPIAFREGTGDPYQRETWWCPHCQPVVEIS